MKKNNPFETGFQGTFGVVAALICIILFWWAIPWLFVGAIIALFVGGLIAIPYCLWLCLAKLLEPSISWGDWIGWLGCAICIATCMVGAAALHSGMAAAFVLLSIGGMIMAVSLITHLLPAQNDSEID